MSSDNEFLQSEDSVPGESVLSDDGKWYIHPDHFEFVEKHGWTPKQAVNNGLHSNSKGLGERWSDGKNKAVKTRLLPEWPNSKGGRTKYHWKKGLPTFHHVFRPVVKGVTKRAIICEGFKQGLAVFLATGEDTAVFVIHGCWSQATERYLEIDEIDEVYLIPDADILHNLQVRNGFDNQRGNVAAQTDAAIRFVIVPGGGTTGIDDYLFKMAPKLEDRKAVLERLLKEAKEKLGRKPRATPSKYVDTSAEPIDPNGEQEGSEPLTGVEPVSLAECEAVYSGWLGKEYDLDSLRLTLIVAAVERMDGDPLWAMIISGPGNTKTETIQPLARTGAEVVSNISSIGALLSATAKKDRASDATGGLLRKLGKRGVLVVKDFTSILSMNPTVQAEVLGALREVYDGRWSREVGVDGGRTLLWEGRLGLVGAVTSAWDKHYGVIAQMGDRFVQLRTDSSKDATRLSAGTHAMANLGHEEEMRKALGDAVAGVIAGMAKEPVSLTKREEEILLKAANLATKARTNVDLDNYRGEVIHVDVPEAPTRLLKQLCQVLRGGVAIGMNRTDALNLALRCSRDSVPPLRWAILTDLAVPGNEKATTSEIAIRVNRPRSTVDRQLKSLQALDLLAWSEETYQNKRKKEEMVVRWRWSLMAHVHPEVCATFTEEISEVCSLSSQEEEEKESEREEGKGFAYNFGEMCNGGDADRQSTDSASTDSDRGTGSGVNLARLFESPSAPPPCLTVLVDDDGRIRYRPPSPSPWAVFNGRPPRMDPPEEDPYRYRFGILSYLAALPIAVSHYGSNIPSIPAEPNTQRVAMELLASEGLIRIGACGLYVSATPAGRQLAAELAA